MNREIRVWISRSAAFAVAFACLGMAGVAAHAQAPAKPDQQKAPDQQKPVPSQPPAANPFPDDTTNVPVLPSTDKAPAASNAAPEPPPVLPSDNTDPVRSPDQPVGESDDSGSQGFSSSNAGLDKVPTPSDTDTRSRRHGKQPEPEHHETAKEDESVAAYYLGQKNWKAALSRYESAVVLDPENPDVYWGMAEAQRHLGRFAEAKKNYQLVTEYDPDSKHAKDAKKLLEDPQLANARPVPTAAPPKP